MNPSQGSKGPGGDLVRHSASSSLSGSNSTWVEDLYERFLAGESVPEDWRRYFTSFAAARTDTPHGPILRALEERARQPRAPHSAAAPPAQGEKQAAVSRLVQIYTNRGHLIAKLDPLGLLQRPKPRVMDLQYMGLDNSDLDTEFFTASRIEAMPRRAKLRDILSQLERD